MADTATAGTWFSPEQLKAMQQEFGLSPLATELIGQAPAMIQRLKSIGGGGMGMGMMGMGGGLLKMLGGMGGGGEKDKGPSRKDMILQQILQNIGGTPAPVPEFAPAPTPALTPASLTPAPPAPVASAPLPPVALQPPGMEDPMAEELARQRQLLLRRPAPGDDMLARYLGAR